MSKVVGPDLRKLMDKKMTVKLNGNRRVTGVLRGYDQFMNIVVDEAVDDTLPPAAAGAAQPARPTQQPLGMVVIRGNSIVMLEPLEKVA
eukprot:m51a1_g12023 putative small nuclear ribonucleoprotein g (89) ;mRNA; r:240-506